LIAAKIPSRPKLSPAFFLIISSLGLNDSSLTDGDDNHDHTGAPGQDDYPQPGNAEGHSGAPGNPNSGNCCPS